MKSLFQYIAPPSQCGYLPEQLWSLEYEIMAAISPREYLDRMRKGWRRFGNMLFRPRCPGCMACRSLRVKTEHFRPNRSQKRARQLNENSVHLEMGKPSVTPEKLNLYDRYHAFQTLHKSWPEHPAKDATSYAHSFVDNPFPTEEWCYYLENKLVAVGYVDNIPGGISAIYFFYDPAYRQLSLGTWNVLRIIEECHLRNIPHLYLGYYVDGCRSLSYKANFTPNQILEPNGVWRDFSD